MRSDAPVPTAFLWPSLCLSWGWSLPSQVVAPAAHVDHRLIAPLRTAEAVEGVDRARREEPLRRRAVEVAVTEHVLVRALVRRACVVLVLRAGRVMKPLGPRCAVGESAGRHRASSVVAGAGAAVVNTWHPSQP